MTELIIHGFAGSTYTRTARMACVEAEVPHRLVPLPFKQPAHFALHPFGRMPILQDGDVTLLESLAIVTYVDHKYGRGRLQPADPADRARAVQRVSAGIDDIYRVVVGEFVKQEQPSAEARKAAREQLRIVDEALAKSSYLASDKLSVADLML